MKHITSIWSRPVLITAIAIAPTMLPAANINPLAGIQIARVDIGKDRVKAERQTPTSLSEEEKARADRYKLVSIEIPGALYVYPFEINNRRIVSGFYGDALGNTHSFLWVNGQVITIDKPGAQITSVAAITDTGLLFGNWGSDSEQHAGFYNLATATWTQLPDIPGYPINYGSRMNKAGHAVGSACLGLVSDPNPIGCTGWSWDGEHYTLYVYPGAINTYPYGINNRGKEVGLWVKAQYVYLGFTRRRGAIDPLMLFTHGEEFHPTAYDINNNGDILAAAPLDPSGFWPSFILRGEYSVTRLPDFPGVLRTFYEGMNEREDLVGIWFNDPSGFPVSGFVAFHKQTRDCDFVSSQDREEHNGCGE